MTPTPEREAERRAVVAWLRGVISRGYVAPSNKADRCEHGRFGWEDCIACYDELLESELQAIERGDHVGDER